MFYVYERWDGTQQVLSFDAEELMDALSDDLLADGDVGSALQRLLQWGDEGRLGDRLKGLRQLLEQLRERRQQELQRHDIDSVADQLREKLKEVVELERAGIQRRLDEAGAAPPRSPREPTASSPADQSPPADASNGQPASAGARPPGETGAEPASAQASAGEQPGADGEQDGLRSMLEKIAERKRQALDSLPPDLGGQIKALNDYEFMDPEARQKFQELLQMLQQQVMQSYFKGLQQSIQNLTPEQMQAIKEMVRDLNRMLEQRQRGEEPDFQSFMQKHGQFFPPEINSLDELMEHLRRQMAQMQSLLESMSPEMRQSLQDMMDAALGDDRLRFNLAQLAANLEMLLPEPGLGQPYPFSGDEPLTLAEAMEIMDRLQGMDELEQAMRAVRSGNDLDRIDSQQVQKLMGDEARQSLDQLKQLAQMLEEAGYIEKHGRRYELTPRAIRRIGQKALGDIFAHLKQDRYGRHATTFRGTGSDRTDETKRYEFSDPFLIDLQKTLMNAMTRGGAGTPVHLDARDFEVYRTELTTRSATVLMVDMSRSMILRGCFFAAKKVALALNSLIRSQFPRDQLYILAFSDYAREIKPEALPQLTWNDYVYGTNIQHGFMLARQLLARHRGGNRQIILITDGEPTAHLENGRVFFAYPPTHRTFQETLREVARCTRDSIVINTFMLERGYYLTDFVNQMTKINHGRAFFAAPESLGEYILVDYVNNKKKRIA